MCLKGGKLAEDMRQIVEFSKLVLAFGDGELPNTMHDDPKFDPQVIIPDKFLIKASQVVIQEYCRCVYPDLLINMPSTTYLSQRSIIAPTNAVVGDINDNILQVIPGETYTYYSQDSLTDEFCAGNDFRSAFPVEFINAINLPCLLKHELKLKFGCVVMLMRNLNQIRGLCNGTGMIVRKCLKNSTICQILSRSDVGTMHIIRRIEVMPIDTPWPFNFNKVEFPVQFCFAMTINKSLDQSLDIVGLYLPRPVFTHGQLYVGVSRVTSSSGLNILIYDDHDRTTNVTVNVV